jgi:hypothetical protein
MTLFFWSNKRWKHYCMYVCMCVYELWCARTTLFFCFKIEIVYICVQSFTKIIIEYMELNT